MGRGGFCGRCGGAKRGIRARQSQPVAQCGVTDCRVLLCEKHAVWDTANGQYVCTACARRHGLRVIKN